MSFMFNNNAANVRIIYYIRLRKISLNIEIMLNTNTFSRIYFTE